MVDQNEHPSAARDERPRPKFGELAPPGWSWQPPQDAERLDTTRHSPAASEAEPTAPPSDRPHATPPPEGHEARATPPTRAAVPRWDPTLTVGLLAFGFFGMLQSIDAIQSLPAALEELHSSLSLGVFTPTESVGPLVTAASITLVVVWAVSAALSVWLLVRKRRAFYVPLIAGVLAMIAVFVFATALIMTDPALLEHYGGTVPTQ